MIFRNFLFYCVSCIILGFLGNIENQCQNVCCNIAPALPLWSEVLIVWSGLHKHIWSEGQGYANIKDAWKYASIRYAWNSFNAFPQCIGAVRSILHSAKQCKLLMMKVRNCAIKEYILQGAQKAEGCKTSNGGSSQVHFVQCKAILVHRSTLCDGK